MARAPSVSAVPARHSSQLEGLESGTVLIAYFADVRPPRVSPFNRGGSTALALLTAQAECWPRLRSIGAVSLPCALNFRCFASGQVFVILFGVGTSETEGIYSLRALSGDDGLPQDTIIAFECEDDAMRCVRRALTSVLLQYRRDVSRCTPRLCICGASAVHLAVLGLCDTTCMSDRKTCM